MTSHAGTSRRAGRGSRARGGITSYLMLLPFLALFTGFLLWPLANSLYLSFTDFDGVNAPRFTGVENFRRLLFEDDRFRQALGNTFLYVVASVVLGTLFSLGLALAFHGPSWPHRIMRTIFFLPSVTSTIAIMMMWKWIFWPDDYGLANSVMGRLGRDRAVEWLATPGLAIYVVVTSLIGAFQIFEAVYLVFRTNANTIGGVLDSALMIVPYLYDQGFTHFKLGYASAIAWVLFLIIFAVSLMNLRLGRATKEL